ncbi:SDR family oxidoreductase [Flavobacterium gawalongense]|uniref:NAD-dependent epimerase/dehydratase family protein n=1 Tax=Flavobacterium gawalongense TaxID=2594432 RepID=A0A553BEN6_9FLAO|nr:SDR family oxidoreductase [Flavobacterium gawalongense]TRW99077.1 NAD-dependent epimerase/dehydratase family protein [Flavobacterium gawalongense]TRX03801.1 NAD-dependent epimerase/dehydratase family protein [Flavobacterium gawalongense]TRX06718.1 NAD-dependent epimerase/dehydratase family protein [Flavobacterium gawalongense]TRX07585.1 NAD-dependent epimerase/dehydratase family protein [Flavobacterium gawalongense]TRX23414.1 NAD-dependent epimerase/dehydratase family protein [Flavobacteriu
MKIILTGATGVLGSHIMYEILELFINKKIEGKLFIIARNKGKNSALDRINELLSSNYTPKIIKDKGITKLHEYIEIIDTDLAVIQDTFSSQIKDAYFIHSAGYVNLSTDEEQREKIFDENTKITKSLFNLFHPFIKKFIYISTAFSSGERKGLIDNDFHNLDFIPEHRNAYENAKFHSENFVVKQCKSLGLPYQILRPSVIGGKMLGKESNYFISKYMVFYLLAKFFHFTAQRKNEQENVRFIINEKTGLNIIPVDYVAKVIVNTFEREDIQQLNIVNDKSFNIVKGLQLIMKEVGYTNFTLIQSSLDFKYKNTIEKLYYESIGKHLKPYLVTEANEYDTTLLNSILEIPKLDQVAFTNMIRYARLNNFKDINV